MWRMGWSVAAALTASVAAQSEPVRVVVRTQVSGEAVAGVGIDVLSSILAMETPLLSLTTGASGEAVIDDARDLAPDGNPESLLVRADGPGLAVAAQNIPREATIFGEPLVFDMRPEMPVSGEIVWSDGTPVANARLLFQGGTAVELETDAQGRFETSELGGRPFDLAIAPAGEPFQNIRSYTVDPLLGLVDVSCHPLVISRRIGVVTGQVVDALSSTPQPDVEVWLGDELSGKDAWTTRTDADGRFRFTGIPLESWEISLPEGGRSFSCFLSAAHPEVSVRLLRPARICVAGIAVDSDTGEPIDGARFGFTNWTAGGEVVEASTEADGHFRAEGVRVANPCYGDVPSENPPAGLVFESPDERLAFWGDPRPMFAVRSAADAQRLLLEVTPVSPPRVLALDDAGNPLPGITVEMAWPEYGGEGFSRQGITDERGEFRGFEWGGSRWLAIGHGPNHRLLVSTYLAAASREAILRPIRIAPLELTLLGVNGEPASATVTLSPARGADHPLLRDLAHTAQMGPEGRAVIESAARIPYSWRADFGWGVDVSRIRTEGQIDLAASPEIQEITLRLASFETTEQAFRVVDLDGAPIAGADVGGQITGADGRVRVPMLRDAWEHAAGIEALGFAAARATLPRFVSREIEAVLHPPVRITAAIASENAESGNGTLTFWTPSRGDEHWALAGAARLEAISTGRVAYFGGTSGQNLQGTSSYFDFPAAPQHTEAARPDAPPEEPQSVKRQATLTLDPLTLALRPDTGPTRVRVVALQSTDDVAVAEFTLTSETSGEVDLGMLRLTPGCRLDGALVEADGRPGAGGAQWQADWYEEGGRMSRWGIVVRSLVYGTAPWNSLVDGDGRFTLSALPSGEWCVRLRGPRERVQWVTVNLPVSGEQRFTFAPERSSVLPGGLLVQVLDEHGEPMPGVEAWSQTRSDAAAFVPSVTDSRGEARLAGPGHWLRGWACIQWRGPWCRTRLSQPVSDSGDPTRGETVVFDLRTLVDVTLNGSPRAYVRLERIDRTAEAATLLDENGAACVAVPIGTYRVWRAGQSREEVIEGPQTIAQPQLTQQAVVSVGVGRDHTETQSHKGAPLCSPRLRVK